MVGAHTKRLKYCSYEKIDKHSNNFGKGWSPGSELMLCTNTSTLPTLKIDLSDHPFIKYYIFEGNVNFPPESPPLKPPHNTVNTTTCHASLIQKTTSHVIMHFQIETGRMFGSSALAEKNQHQHNIF